MDSLADTSDLCWNLSKDYIYQNLYKMFPLWFFKWSKRVTVAQLIYDKMLPLHKSL